MNTENRFDQVPFIQKDHLEYPELTMFQMVERIAAEYPAEPAYEFYNRKTGYGAFIRKIEQAARVEAASGVRLAREVRVLR